MMSSVVLRAFSRSSALQRVPVSGRFSWHSSSGQNYSNFSPSRTLLPNRHQPTIVFLRNESSLKDSTVFGYLSDSAATEVMRSAAVYVHDFTGLPWWASVVIMTTALRTLITFPLGIYQSYILAKVENLRMLDMPEIAPVMKKKVTQRALAENWSEKRASLQYKIEMKKKWDELVVKNNCHPFKASVTLWVQIPTWVFFSAALRNLAYMLPANDAAAQVTFLELSVGGFLWVPNLTQPDGLWLMPLILGLSNLAIVEMQVIRRLTDPTRFQRYVTNFFRMFSIALIPIASTVPSVLCLYWTTSSLLGLVQNLALMSNRLRVFCRIPETPTTSDHPYRQLMTDLKDRIASVKRR